MKVFSLRKRVRSEIINIGTLFIVAGIHWNSLNQSITQTKCKPLNSILTKNQVIYLQLKTNQNGFLGIKVSKEYIVKISD